MAVQIEFIFQAYYSKLIFFSDNPIKGGTGGVILTKPIEEILLNFSILVP